MAHLTHSAIVCHYTDKKPGGGVRTHLSERGCGAVMGRFFTRPTMAQMSQMIHSGFSV